jgi:hypothetical protein
MMTHIYFDDSAKRDDCCPDDDSAICNNHVLREGTMSDRGHAGLDRLADGPTVDEASSAANAASRGAKGMSFAANIVLPAANSWFIF